MKNLEKFYALRVNKKMSLSKFMHRSNRFKIKHEVDNLIKQVYRLFVKENYEECFSLLESAIKLMPEDPRAFYMLGLIHEEIGNYPKAKYSYFVCALLRKKDCGLWRKVMWLAIQTQDIRGEAIALERIYKREASKGLLEKKIECYRKLKKKYWLVGCEIEMFDYTGVDKKVYERVFEKIRKTKHIITIKRLCSIFLRCIDRNEEARSEYFLRYTILNLYKIKDWMNINKIVNKYYCKATNDWDLDVYVINIIVDMNINDKIQDNGLFKKIIEKNKVIEITGSIKDKNDGETNNSISNKETESNNSNLNKRKDNYNDNNKNIEIRYSRDFYIKNNITDKYSKENDDSGENDNEIKGINDDILINDYNNELLDYKIEEQISSVRNKDKNIKSKIKKVNKKSNIEEDYKVTEEDIINKAIYSIDYNIQISNDYTEMGNKIKLESRKMGNENEFVETEIRNDINSDNIESKLNLIDKKTEEDLTSVNKKIELESIKNFIKNTDFWKNFTNIKYAVDLADNLFKMNYIEESFEILEKIYYRSNMISIRIKMGDMLYKKERYNEAIEVYKEVMDKDPTNMYVKSMLHRISVQMNDDRWANGLEIHDKVYSHINCKKNNQNYSLKACAIVRKKYEKVKELEKELIGNSNIINNKIIYKIESNNDINSNRKLETIRKSDDYIKKNDELVNDFLKNDFLIFKNRGLKQQTQDKMELSDDNMISQRTRLKKITQLSKLHGLKTEEWFNIIKNKIFLLYEMEKYIEVVELSKKAARAYIFRNTYYSIVFYFIQIKIGLINSDFSFVVDAVKDLIISHNYSYFYTCKEFNSLQKNVQRYVNRADKYLKYEFDEELFYSEISDENNLKIIPTLNRIINNKNLIKNMINKKDNKNLLVSFDNTVNEKINNNENNTLDSSFNTLKIINNDKLKDKNLFALSKTKSKKITKKNSKITDNSSLIKSGLDINTSDEIAFMIVNSYLPRYLAKSTVDAILDKNFSDRADILTLMAIISISHSKSRVLDDKFKYAKIGINLLNRVNDNYESKIYNLAKAYHFYGYYNLSEKYYLSVIENTKNLELKKMAVFNLSLIFKKNKSNTILMHLLNKL